MKPKKTSGEGKPRAKRYTSAAELHAELVKWADSIWPAVDRQVLRTYAQPWDYAGQIRDALDSLEKLRAALERAIDLGTNKLGKRTNPHLGNALGPHARTLAKSVASQIEWLKSIEPRKRAGRQGVGALVALIMSIEKYIGRDVDKLTAAVVLAELAGVDQMRQLIQQSRASYRDPPSLAVAIDSVRKRVRLALAKV